MKVTQLKEYIQSGALSGFSHLYADIDAQKERFIRAIDGFVNHFGDEREVALLSVPGRSELLGNHTDHNGGKVIAGAIDRDIIAVVAKNDDGRINFMSEGYSPDTVELSKCDSSDNFSNFTSSALIAGIVNGFEQRGYKVGGYDAYSTSDVLKGSGISSSAAYEVMIGNALNYLYNDGKIQNTEIAKISQYSENVYFGKPSGLMDQMACAVGGFVYMNFASAQEPVIEPIDFSLTEIGYELCIVNTGGNHADLNDDYASIPQEMCAVAHLFGQDLLRSLKEKDILERAADIRKKCGDRALLRALHFARENERVEYGKTALKEKNAAAFFTTVEKSGRSSFQYLQNVYTNKNVAEQGLSLALAITDGFDKDIVAAFRVHGGGFAGTIQAYVKTEYADRYVAAMNSVFGDGAVMRLRVRATGATKLF